ncbi:MAG: hypothetical protein WDW38_000489 [Sanguina aurantia]
MLLTLAWRRYRHGRSEIAASNALRGQQQARLAALIAQSSGNNVMANQYLLVELVRMYGPAAMSAFDPATGEFRGLSYLPQGLGPQQGQQYAAQQRQQQRQQGDQQNQIELQPPPRVWDVHLIVEPDGTVGMATKLDDSGEKVEESRASSSAAQCGGVSGAAGGAQGPGGDGANGPPPPPGRQATAGGWSRTPSGSGARSSSRRSGRDRGSGGGGGPLPLSSVPPGGPGRGVMQRDRLPRVE